MERRNGYIIPFKGLRNGVHAFRFEIDDALFAAYEQSEIEHGSGEVRVELHRSEQQLVLKVAIEARVTVPCDRCLEPLELPVAYEGTLAVRFSEEEHEYDGEMLWLYPGDTEVDLTQYVYESIVLALPYRRVHPDGGCDPAMLERFRIVSQQEFDAIEAHAEGPDEAGETEDDEEAEAPRESEDREAAADEESGAAGSEADGSEADGSEADGSEADEIPFAIADADEVNARWRRQLAALKERMEKE